MEKKYKNINLGEIHESDLEIIIAALEYCGLVKAPIETSAYKVHDETFCNLADILKDCKDNNISISKAYEKNMW